MWIKQWLSQHWKNLKKLITTAKDNGWTLYPIILVFKGKYEVM